MNRRYTVSTLAQRLEVDERTLYHFIEVEWLSPCANDPWEFDEEDLARAKLICELQRDFGVNEEGISLILHLVDQMNYMQTRVRQMASQR